MDFKRLSITDPLKRTAKKQASVPEFSPMDPPNPYSPPNTEDVPYEEMPKFLQGLMDDHEAFRAALDPFEQAIVRMRQEGLKPGSGVDEALREFFRFYDERIVDHHVREEKLLFPVLHERLIEIGEHSREEPPQTGVDVLEDDHVRIIQLIALTFNFLGMAARLPDPASRAMVLDAALQQGSALVELLRLHMFREDHVAFALAAKHLTDGEFEEMSRHGASSPSKPI